MIPRILKHCWIKFLGETPQLERTPIHIPSARLKKPTDKPYCAYGGHLPKAFAIFHFTPIDLKSSREDKISLMFGDLIRELLSGKSSYFTYLNQHFLNKKINEINLPHSIQCVIKKASAMHIVYNELVGSRLGNQLGVDVVYNLPYTSDPEGQEYDSVISVDFLPEGYEEIKFDKIKIHPKILSLEECLQRIDEGLSELAKDKKIVLDDGKTEAFKKSFIKQYLFKKLICEDLDFAGRNVCFFINKDGDYIMGPAFDMEQFFFDKMSQGYFKEIAERDLAFLHKVMPDVLEDFLKKCTAAVKSGEVDRIMNSPNNPGKIDSKTHQNIYTEAEMVKTNINRLWQIHEKLKNPPVMES